MKKEETPNYVKEAVLKFLEEKEPLYLVQMFENGIPLHVYPESRNIIISLLQGKPIRKKGTQPLTRKDKDDHYAILMRVAELHGAGLAVINKSPEYSHKITACSIVTKEHNLKSEDHVYKAIWKPNKDRDIVKKQMKMGASNKWLLDDYI